MAFALVYVFVILLELMLSSNQQSIDDKEYYLDLPDGHNRLKVCDNVIVNDIPGGKAAVLKAGQDYLEFMKNTSRTGIEPFFGLWKWEFYRILGPFVPECKSLRVFGNEASNYDEAKRFCHVLRDPSEIERNVIESAGEENKSGVDSSLNTGGQSNEFGLNPVVDKDLEKILEAGGSKMIMVDNENNTMSVLDQIRADPAHRNSPCEVYSVGSNNKWDFEEYIHASTNCTIDTFDCTCKGKVPKHIRDRTRFHHICLGAEDFASPDGTLYLTLARINAFLGRRNGPDFFKLDVEGFEWSVLKAFARQADSHPQGHAQLPLQIYTEYHLDRDVDDGGKRLTFKGADSGAHVGPKLRHFFDAMLLKAGYMIMHRRVTLQTRNTDVLLTKVFCRD